MKQAFGKIYSGQRSHHVGSSAIFVAGRLRIRQYHMFKMVAITLFGYTFVKSGIDAALYKSVMILGNQRHEIGFSVKMKRLVFENFYGAKCRRTRRLKFPYCFFNTFLVGKMQESAYDGVRRVHRPSGHEFRKKITGGFYFKSVMEHLMLNRIILVKIKKSVFSANVGQGKKI